MRLRETEAGREHLLSTRDTQLQAPRSRNHYAEKMTCVSGGIAERSVRGLPENHWKTRADPLKQGRYRPCFGAIPGSHSDLQKVLFEQFEKILRSVTRPNRKVRKWLGQTGTGIAKAYP